MCPTQMTPMRQISSGDEVSITGCPPNDVLSTARTGPCRMEAVPGVTGLALYTRGQGLGSLPLTKPNRFHVFRGFSQALQEDYITRVQNRPRPIPPRL